MSKFDINAYNDDQLFEMECNKVRKDINTGGWIFISAFVVLIPGLFIALIVGYLVAVIVFHLTIHSGRAALISIGAVVVSIGPILYLFVISYNKKQTRFKRYIVRKVLDQKTDLRLYNGDLDAFKKKKDKIDCLLGLNLGMRCKYYHHDYAGMIYRGYSVRYTDLWVRKSVYDLFKGITVMIKLPKKVAGERIHIVTKNLANAFEERLDLRDAPINQVDGFASSYCFVRCKDRKSKNIDIDQELIKLSAWEKEMQALNCFDKPLVPLTYSGYEFFDPRDLLSLSLGKFLALRHNDSFIVSLLIDSDVLIFSMNMRETYFEAESGYSSLRTELIMERVENQRICLFYKSIDPLIDELERVFPVCEA